MKFVLSPNLPKNIVKVVLLSSGADIKIIKALDKQGIESILVPQCDNLQAQVNSHPDMLCHHLGGNQIVIHKQIIDIIGSKLEKLGFEVIQSDFDLKPDYPNDCALNIARISDRILCNQNIIDKNINSYIEQKGIKKITISQGYAKCSVCIINDNNIITSDKGIAQAAINNGIDVLLIRCGYINIAGYNYGFIGGTCGKISADKLCFAGNIKLHPSFDIMRKFLHKNGAEAVCLTNEVLEDIGSILPIVEE
jgi:rRNA-processing protein FCF1